MEVLVILVLGFALVQCDVGYKYKPITSYDAPFSSVGLLRPRHYYHVEQQGLHKSLQTPVLEYTLFGNSKIFTPTSTSIPTIQQDFTTANILGASFKSPTTLNGFAVDTHYNGIPVTTESYPNLHQFNAIPTLPTLLPHHEVTTISSLNDFSSTPKPIIIGTKSNFDQEVLNIFPKTFFQPHISTGFTKSKNVIHKNSGHQKKVEVEKHLYFFAAPEETEEIKPRIILPPAPAKKNVKLVFIKAPAFKTAPITVPLPQQNEEKTKVYVLVKKPDEPQVVIPTPEPTKAAKPEVFFIKYKTQKEAEEAVANLQEEEEPQFETNLNANDLVRTGVNFETQADNFNFGTQPIVQNNFETVTLSAPAVKLNPSVLQKNYETVTFAPIVKLNNANVQKNFETVTFHTPILNIGTPEVSTTGEGLVHIQEEHVAPKLHHSHLLGLPFGKHNNEHKVISFDSVNGIQQKLNEHVISTTSLPTLEQQNLGAVKVHEEYGLPKERK